ncbi:MAG: glutaredoxin family protein [Wolbachia endosymbiont of Meromenopon meropis]|nr:glutaredoxin family protein [Wolbachia endosymbiont of Meromenopon meropis]
MKNFKENFKEKVIIYVKQYCPFCKKAKELLDEKGVKYEEIDVIKNSDLFSEIKSKYNVKTVPQIFFVDKNGNYSYHIAGCDKLMDLEEQGRLDDILNNNYYKADLTTHSNSNNEHEYVISNDDFM